MEAEMETMGSIVPDDVSGMPTDGDKVTQRDRVIAKLESQGYITNDDLWHMGLLHSGRNRITEAETKEYFLKKGQKISECILGKEFMQNRWNVEPILGEDHNVAIAGETRAEGNVVAGIANGVAEAVNPEPTPSPLYFEKSGQRIMDLGI